MGKDHIETDTLDGIEKPVTYFSKKLNEIQKKKKAIHLECLAVKEALVDT